MARYMVYLAIVCCNAAAAAAYALWVLVLEPALRLSASTVVDDCHVCLDTTRCRVVTCGGGAGECQFKNVMCAACAGRWGRCLCCHRRLDTR